MLAGCGGAGVAPSPCPRPRRRCRSRFRIPGGTAAGLDRVIGQTGNTLIGLFGQPAADVREGQRTKLQFGNAICVLDAYLYPKGH